MRKPILEFRSVNSFSRTQNGIRNVSFTIFEGEMISLIGADNSGIDSIPHVLTGERPYCGEVLLREIPFAPRNMNEANRQGVYCIPPLGSFLNNQTIAENFCIHTNRIPLHRLVRDRIFIQDTQAILDRFGLDIRATDLAGDYSQTAKRALEALKYVHMGARVIVLSNVTKGVTDSERRMMLRILRQICQTGVAVLSLNNQCADHRKVYDRTMLFSRAGRLVRVLYEDDLDEEQIRRYLCRFDASATAVIHHMPPGEEVLRIENASGRSLFSFHRGEIVGFLDKRPICRSRRAGEILEDIRCRGYRLLAGEETVDIREEEELASRGICFIPGDIHQIYFPDLSIEDNAVFPFLGHVSDRLGIVRKGNLAALRQDARRWIDRMRVEFDYDPSDDLIYSVVVRCLMYPYRLVAISHPNYVNDVRKASILVWMMDLLLQQGCAIAVISRNWDSLMTHASVVHELPSDAQSEERRSFL